MLYGYDSPEAVCAELMEENRKLKAEVEMLQKENHRFADIGKMYSEIRAEVINEYREKVKQALIDKGFYPVLVKLIEQGDKAFADKYTGEVMLHIDELYEFIADHLLDDGVIVPPCKVGDTVYVIDDWGYKKELKEREVGVIAIKGTNDFSKELWEDVYGGHIGTFAEVGKTVFLSKAEAEYALKNRRSVSLVNGHIEE